MPEAIVVDLVVGDLADKIGRHGNPVVGHFRRVPAGGGAAQAACRATCEEEPSLPSMPRERNHQRPEPLQKLPPALLREGRSDPDVAEEAIVAVEPKQE